MKRSSVVRVVACVVGVALTGCAGLRSGGKDNPVVASVNGEAIRLADLTKSLQQIPKESQVDTRSSIGRRAVLDSLVNQKLLWQEAEKAGIPERQAIKDWVKAQEEQVILNQLVYEKFGQRLTASDEETEKYYEANKDSLVVPERRHVRHIVVETEEEAKEIREKLESGGDFEKLAEEESLEDWKAKGGDLGFIEQRSIIPEFGEVAFSLKVDELSEPVKTQFGYHIIQVKEIQEPRQLELDELRDEIKRVILQQKRNALLSNWISQLRAESNIVVNGAVLARSSNYQLEVLGVDPVPAPPEEK